MKHKILSSTVATSLILVGYSVVAGVLFVGCSVKPQAILSSEVKSDVQKSLDELNKLSLPVLKPITLDEAIERAIANNLSKKLDILSSALAHQKIDIVAYEALPSLTAKGGYSARDNYAASASTSFVNGEPEPLGASPSYSVSQDKESTNAGVAFSWNVLDFGLSYVRAGQQANRFLIAKEKERKSIHNIKQEVRNAYYRAVSADELLQRITPVMEKTKQAFEDSKNIAKLKLDTPMKGLTYQRELLEVIRSLNTLEENLIKSKTELARLMGLKPGTSFELAEKIQERYQLPNITIPIDELERLALEHRPELQETRYQQKISEAEVKAAMLKMLPGINLNAGYSYDSNQYALNNNWMSYGANVSWNLLNVFNGNLNKKLAQTQVELAKQQKLALSMAVISQVHLSLLDFYQAKKAYQLSEDYYSIAKDIFIIIENENTLDVNGKLSLIKETLNFLIANLRLSSSYARVQNAYGKVISSVGNDTFFKEVNPELLVEKKLDLEGKPEPIVTAKLELAKEKEIEVSEVKEPQEEREVQEEPVVAPEIKKYAYVKEDANVREGSNINSEVVKIVMQGSEVEILEIVKEAGKTWYKTPDGYIFSDLLDPII